jgi:hypothetical protein
MVFHLVSVELLNIMLVAAAGLYITLRLELTRKEQTSEHKVVWVEVEEVVRKVLHQQ